MGDSGAQACVVFLTFWYRSNGRAIWNLCDDFGVGQLTALRGPLPFGIWNLEFGVCSLEVEKKDEQRQFGITTTKKQRKKNEHQGWKDSSSPPNVTGT
jgi:hypothetical protein